jgi:HK97 family phage prohead protease
MQVINKSLTSPVEQIVGTASPTYRFIISTDDVDRDGDIVKQDGWDFSEFNQNPIALLQHNHAQPVGRWSNVTTRQRTKGGYETVADLTLAPPVSDILKYANALVEAGILNATSVGFAVKAFEKRKDASGKPLSKGHIIHKAVLREVSLVSVPANQSAIRIAKSMAVSDEVLKSCVSFEGVDSDIDLDNDTPTALTLALDKATELLKGFTPSKPINPNSVFAKPVKQVKIKSPQLLMAYKKAMSVIKGN